MKPFNYYTTTKTLHPLRKDYTTHFVYDKGAVIGSFRDYERTRNELAKEYPGAVIQSVVDEEAYREHLSQHNSEFNDLRTEFENDLFKEFRVSENPKRFKCLELARDRRSTEGLSAVYEEFAELCELIY